MRMEQGVHTSAPESPSPGDGEFRAYAGSNDLVLNKGHNAGGYL